MACMQVPKIPVTVLTGFLGSGKTTLLNHILTASHGKKLAVIENEFGAVSIDDELLKKNTKEQSDEEIIEVMNGCMCCTVRKDLITVLQKLATRQQTGQIQLDGIIIETTGMADPAPIAQTFFVDPVIQRYIRLDGILTLVDAKHIEQHLDEKKPDGVVNESIEQVAFADRLLLNKTDLVTEEDLDRIEGRLKDINAFAPIRRCCQSNVSVDSVLNLHAFDLARVLEQEPDFVDITIKTKHDSRVSSHSINQDGDVDVMDFRRFLHEMINDHGAEMYRMKGVVSVAHAERRLVYQAVHMNLSSGFDQPWGDDEPRRSKLVFIGKNLDKRALTEKFMACLSTPERREEKIRNLRFSIGDKVQCNTGCSEWSNGTVIGYMYRDEYMQPGLVAPYQIRLDDGDLIFAPEDDDEVIRRAPGQTESAAPAKAQDDVKDEKLSKNQKRKLRKAAAAAGGVQAEESEPGAEATEMDEDAGGQ